MSYGAIKLKAMRVLIMIMIMITIIIIIIIIIIINWLINYTFAFLPFLYDN